MVVRTWRKISAPGRLGQQSKYSPSNVLQPTSPDKSKQSRPGDSEVASPTRRVSRQLFQSQTIYGKSKSFDWEPRECTPGEVAINCLLQEFSSYAHKKIEKALRTVKWINLPCFYQPERLTISRVYCSIILNPLTHLN